jgi:RNA polymerase sigma-70 factor (ECF subfamily)
MKLSRVAAGLTLTAGIAVWSVQAAPPKPELNLKPTITSGKQVALMVGIPGSLFRDVDLSGTEFDNVNMSKARLHNIDLTDVSISAANLGGAHFKHIGPAPGPNGRQARQKAVTFEEAMLCDSTFRKVDMSNVKLIDCDMRGMTIDGVLVTDLIAAYKKGR